MARLVSLTVLLTLIVILGITFFKVLAPFLLPLFLAGVVTILCQPLFRYFIRRANQRVRIAAGLTTASILAIVLIPLLVGVFIGAVQLLSLTQDSIGTGRFNRALSELRTKLEDAVFEHVQPYLPTDDSICDGTLQRDAFDARLSEVQENVRAHLQTLAERSLGLAGQKTVDFLGGAISGFLGVLMFAIALYYFLADGPVLIRAAEGLIPVHVGYQRRLLEEFEKVVRAVVLATFLAGIAQGLATSLALYVVGFHHFFILFVVATLASLIPLAGAWLVWGPCAAWLMLDGHWGAALFLVFIGVVVIGTLDNVIRAFVLHSDAKLHPLLAFVSVLGGLQVMGLWGVFTGPMVACCLHALVRIFNVELTEFSKERFAGIRETSSPTEPTSPTSPAQPQPNAAGSSQPSPVAPAVPARAPESRGPS